MDFNCGTAVSKMQLISIIMALATFALTPSVNGDTIMKAGVLGLPGSTDAELYRVINDALRKEERETMRPDFIGGISQINPLDMVDYCKLEFEDLIFDMTNGSTVYETLENARNKFKDDDKKIGLAVGPFIEVFASTNYVITKQYHLLTSPAGQNAAMMDPARVVSILPEPSTLSVGIASLVRQFGWTDVAFLAQGDFSPMQALHQQNIKVWPILLSNSVNSSDDPELQLNLRSMRQSEKDKFILHCADRQMVLHVLEAAQKLHLLHPTMDWLITYPDFEDIAGDGYDWPGTLYGLQLLHVDKLPLDLKEFQRFNRSRLDLGLAVDVVGLMRHILKLEAVNCGTERLIDLYIPPEVTTWNLKNKPNMSARYNGALGVYIWDKETNKRTNFTIDIMKYEHSNSTKIGGMRFDSSGLNISMDDIVSNRTDEEEAFVFGEDYVLWIATKLVDPFIIKRGEHYVGFSHDLLEELRKKVNFNYVLYEVDDYVDALISGNASMAVGAIEVTSERQKLISFSYTIMSSQASILIKKAKGQTSLFQFLAPFSTYLWLLILAFINVASFSLYVMSRFDPSQDGNSNRFDLKESLWYGWNIILQGTTDYSPSTTSMRAIIAFFWFCVVIIDAAYTANLAAFRTLQQIDNRIKTLHDLATQTGLVYGVEKGSDLAHYFENRTEDPYERMWANMKLHEEDAILTNRTDIVERVKDGKMAYISDGVINDYYVKQHCGIESIQQSFAKKDFSIGFPRGAPYLDDINKALLQLKEEGVLDSLKEKWWMEGKNCTDDGDFRAIGQKATAELELTNMTGVFIVLGGSVLLAIIVDVAQRCLSQRQKGQKKEEDGGKGKDEPTEPLELDGNVVENYYTFS